MTGFLALQLAVATLSSPNINFANYNDSSSIDNENENDDEYKLDNDYWSMADSAEKVSTTGSTSLSTRGGRISNSKTGAFTTKPPLLSKYHTKYFSTHRFSSLPSTVPTSTFHTSMSTVGKSNENLNATPASNDGESYDSTRLLLTIALASFLFIIIAWTIIGNLIVFICYINEKRLRTLSNLLILNLACCDLALAILVLPFSASYLVQGNWIFGELWCELWLSIDVLFCTCSIWAIVAIGYDRYQAIHALSSSSGGTGGTSTSASSPTVLQRRNLQTTISLCVAVWLLSGLISIPPLIGWKTTDLYTYDSVLNTAQCILFNTEGYVIYSASGSFIVPSIFIVVVYGKIFHAYSIWIKNRTKQLTTAQPATAARPALGTEMHKTTTTSSISRRNNSQSSNTSVATPINNTANVVGGSVRSKSDAFFDIKLKQKHAAQLQQRMPTSSSLRIRGDEDPSFNEPSSSVNDHTTPKARNQNISNHTQASSSIATNSTASDEQIRAEEQRRSSSHSASPNSALAEASKPTSFSQVTHKTASSPRAQNKLLLLGTPWSPNRAMSSNQLLVPSAALFNSGSESSEIPPGSSSSDTNITSPLVPASQTSLPHRLFLTPNWFPSTTSSPPSTATTTTSSLCCGTKRQAAANAASTNEQRFLQQLETQTLASLSKLTSMSSKTLLQNNRNLYPNGSQSTILMNGFSSATSAVVRQNSEKQFSPSFGLNDARSTFSKNRSSSIGISFYPFTLRVQASPNGINPHTLNIANGRCVRNGIGTVVDETATGGQDADDEHVMTFLNLVRPRAASSQSSQLRKQSNGSATALSPALRHQRAARQKNSVTSNEIRTTTTKSTLRTRGLFSSLWHLPRPWQQNAAQNAFTAASSPGGREGSNSGDASVNYEDESVISETQAAAIGVVNHVADGRASQPNISYTVTTRTGSGRDRNSAGVVQVKQLMEAQNQKRLARRQAREARGLKIVFGILITYFVCWTGFFIMYVVQGFCSSCPLPDALVQTVIWLGYAQSAINPLMYFYTNRDFRTAFLKMIGWMPKKAQQRSARRP